MFKYFPIILLLVFVDVKCVTNVERCHYSIEFQQVQCNRRNDLDDYNPDGSCNNIQNFWWGMADSPLFRMFEPEYSSQESNIRLSTTGHPLPSAKDITNFLFLQEDFDFSKQTLSSKNVLHISFGQFIAHDMTMIRTNDVNRCLCPMMRNTPQCANIVNGESCLEFPRGVKAQDDGNCLRNVKSIPTAFLDLSLTYGGSMNRMNQLREFSNGFLKFHQFNGNNNRMDIRTHFLPRDPNSVPCNTRNKDFVCFAAGDNRANELPFITSTQVMALRLHNMIARDLAQINPHWNDEQLFTIARRINIGLFQHIIYNEYLPTILSTHFLNNNNILQTSSTYNSLINPRITAAFNVAAFRIGHTQLRPDFLVDGQRLLISRQFFKPNLFYEGHLNSIMSGILELNSLKIGLNAQRVVTKEILKTDEADNGIDLISFDIQRGRDIGLKSYVHFRQLCHPHEQPIRSFDDLRNIFKSDELRKIQQIYSDVNDIDLFVGGLAERIDGSKSHDFGSTFSCIIADQFKRSKIGDRLFYTHTTSSFTIQQINAIHSVSLTDLLCSIFNLREVQEQAFFVPSSTNPHRSCSTGRRLDLSSWRE
ncbi:hypothetical protein SNEBB_005514 [Seison nebaliae]|nr:hypothetical protein SNEBB_005514 [Seison nebaliae]